MPSLPTFREDFYPEGFRKIAAMMILFASASLPAVHAWQYGQDDARPAGLAREPMGFGAQGFNGHLGRNAAVENTSKGASWSTWLAMFGGVFGLMLYYPRGGFKRYALMCGPLLGLGTMMLTTVWLEGRQGVYRFELAFAAILGALPGLLMYLTLAWLKFRRLARHQVPVAAAEYVEDVVDAEVID